MRTFLRLKLFQNVNIPYKMVIKRGNAMNRLSDQQLIEAYAEALRLGLNEDFIKVLKEEIELRNQTAL